MQSKPNRHPVQLAGEAHYRLVTIHPFADGNGRIARLLMNLILLMAGYPSAIINPKERLSYITSLETAQTGCAKNLYAKIIFTAARRSLDIYLKSAMGKNIAEPEESGKLLKIGQLAKIAGETIATIRFWIKEVLLEV